MFESGVLSTSLSKTVVPLGYFYAGTVQILAGLLQFLAHDTFGCTAFCSFGAFWVSYAYFVMAIEPLLDKDDLHSAKGVFVLPWVVLSAYMTVISLRTARVLTVTFVLLTLTLFVQTVGQFADSKGCQKAGGWIAFITSLSAGYCSCAFLFLETWKEEILPILFHEHIPVKRRSVVRGFSLSLTPD
ncbi:hypothetical protein CBR_g12590 [Chara braunii]|uniref:GPR1/FUN34/yaaH family protein n=1 Tax=Chara braunii TaxID=69332 RepID=A0A388KS31_CHABU|nr:hypothetical protein CBR_g12590 [Chara braunii]|eukprot:GBG72871.1 hypothetical protein CBR_g12590 [Chara braunii]